MISYQSVPSTLLIHIGSVFMAEVEPNEVNKKYYSIISYQFQLSNRNFLSEI